MRYLITGGTGFIGRHLIEHLLVRGGTVHVLVREESVARLDDLITSWGLEAGRVVAEIGDVRDPNLGMAPERIADLHGTIDHFFHVAAVYDMTASADSIIESNIGGTENAVGLAEALEVGCFHQVSSIAAAGMYKGTWREDMFDEAQDLDRHPYFRSKHDSERIVREQLTRPWRVYRPGIVVGHSQTGEMDKVDGPYYFFGLLKRLRGTVPPWAPMIGFEGREINIVPVDYVVAAIDHIAHQPNLDGRAFHLTDPHPHTAGEVVNIFAKAAGAPRMSMRVDSRITDLLAGPIRAGLNALPPARIVEGQVLRELGIPESVLEYVNYPTHFDSTESQRVLAGTGIEVPRLETYADVLWDYWLSHLDPTLFKNRSLSSVIGGRTVMVTGASSGIGRSAAIKLAAAGATVLLVARSADKLAEVSGEIARNGGKAYTYPCDLSQKEDIDRMADEVIAMHDGVDVLVNNAGRSIRRSVALSYDRLHDFERTMQLNYFGSLQLVLRFLPGMRERGRGQIVNVSSIGVQTNTPRFSAYIASKSALDAFSRCMASEVIDDNVHVTTINMPLVRTPMIAPTKIYDAFPAISPDEAADLIVKALVERPKKVATTLGNFGELLYAVAPKVSDKILNTGYKLFPESGAAKSGTRAPTSPTDEAAAIRAARDGAIGSSRAPDGERRDSNEEPTQEAVAFAHLMRGVHW